MNLKEWARQQGVDPVTAYGGSGRANCRFLPAAPGGRSWLAVKVPAGCVGTVAVYARVSSADQRPDLDRQVARVDRAGGGGLPVGRVVTEVGSALNGKRSEFLVLLRDESVTVVVRSTVTG